MVAEAFSVADSRLPSLELDQNLYIKQNIRKFCLNLLSRGKMPKKPNTQYVYSKDSRKVKEEKVKVKGGN